jgi:hypothetical protein
MSFWVFFRIGPVQDRHEIKFIGVLGGEKSISGGPKCRKLVLPEVRLHPIFESRGQNFEFYLYFWHFFK